MIVRRETPADVAAARAVQVAAFRNQETNDEPVEARLLDALRDCDGWLPALSLVAVLDDAIVGHVVTTRGFVGDVPALGLGPIGVLPSHQGEGVGLALMHATIGASDALGEPLVALLGAPEYYARFGFIASATIGVTAPEAAWGDPLPGPNADDVPLRHTGPLRLRETVRRGLISCGRFTIDRTAHTCLALLGRRWALLRALA